MSFITFYTPTYKRPSYLAVCRQSVQKQTCKDFQHMVIVDDTGIGVDGMFLDIRRHVEQIRGRYVYILADDDRLIDERCVKTLRDFCDQWGNPPVVIVKNWKWGQVFPLVWEAEPELTKIDTGNFVVRADVFRENADAFGLRYEGDFDFIHNLWNQGYPFAWFDYLFSEMQVGGRGRTEEEIMTQDNQPLRVRILRAFAGPQMSLRKGQEVDMPPGADWIRAGLAEATEKAASVSIETATVDAPERAVGPGGKRKRGKKDAL